MDSVRSSVDAIYISSLGIFLESMYFALFKLVRAIELVRLYGTSGLYIYAFGSRATWRLQAQVLGQLRDEDAFAFKKSVTDECTMISVAAALVAQINMIALSLNFLSETHWVARGFVVWSLTASLMAVYYAARQQQNIGRLLDGKSIRQWIRGGGDGPSAIAVLKGVGSRHWLEVIPRMEQVYSDMADLAGKQGRYLFSEKKVRSDRKCDPHQFTANDAWTSAAERSLEGGHSLKKRRLMELSFTPSIAAVMTISAPQILLSVALFALLIALGIYFGFTWTRNLDANAGIHDSRNVFVFYIVGLAACVFVYSISGVIQDEEKTTEYRIVEQYCDDWSIAHEDIVRSWGLQARKVDRGGRETVALEPIGLGSYAGAPQNTIVENQPKEENHSAENVEAV